MKSQKENTPNTVQILLLGASLVSINLNYIVQAVGLIVWFDDRLEKWIKSVTQHMKAVCPPNKILWCDLFTVI